MYKPIHTGRIYEKIVEQIEQRIFSGEPKPGDKLPSEYELAKQFGVSRTAVREAMKALAHKGLIEVSPGRGTFITDSSMQSQRYSFSSAIQQGMDDSYRNLVDVREISEPGIAALAAVRVEEEQVSAIKEALMIMDDSLEDIKTFVEADLDFHLAIAEATQTPIILILIDTMVDMSREFRMRISRVNGGIERAQQHHKRIFEAINDRNP